MGRNSYNGGGTVVHAGSGFFSFKSGSGKKKTQDGSDTPGPAKPGSICVFPTIETRKKKRIFEFPAKTKEERQREQKEREEIRSRNTAKILGKRIHKAINHTEAEIIELRRLLNLAEFNHQKSTEAKNKWELMNVFSATRKYISDINRILIQHGRPVIKIKTPPPQKQQKKT